MKKIILSALLAIFVVVAIAFAEFFPDVIVTSPNGAWTDTRAYTTIDAAITAIGANVRDLYIVREQATVALTIPANAHLHFYGSGSINNTGQLIINTTSISAGDRQIFTGIGDIDWIAGSVVRSTWFSSLDEALDVTSDDSLTMIIAKSETLTADASVGTNVTLKWESPFIITDGGFTLDGLKKIEAGTYQIFSGAGDFDFLAGSIVHSSWFVSLRTAITYTTDENVNLTILVDQPEAVDFDVTIDAYQSLKVEKGCLITVDAGQTLTINGGIDAGSYQIFGATGDLDFSAGSVLRTSWFSTLELADTFTNDDNVELTLLVDKPETIVASMTLDIFQSLKVEKGCIITINAGQVLTAQGDIIATIHQIFGGTGTVNLVSSLVKVFYPEWWGASTGNSTVDSFAAINAMTAAMATSTSGAKAIFSSGTYYISEPWLLDTLQNLVFEGTGSMAHTKYGTCIRAMSTFVGSEIIKIDNCISIEFKGINVYAQKADDTTQYNGIVITGDNTPPVHYIKLEKFSVKKANTAIYIGSVNVTNYQYQNCTIRDFYLYNVETYGIHIRSRNVDHLIIDNATISTVGATAYGIYFERSGVIHLTDIAGDGNAEAGSIFMYRDVDGGPLLTENCQSESVGKHMYDVSILAAPVVNIQTVLEEIYEIANVAIQTKTIFIGGISRDEIRLTSVDAMVYSFGLAEQAGSSVTGDVAGSQFIRMPQLNYYGTFVWDPGNCVDGASVSTTKAVTGAVLGMRCEVTAPYSLQGLILYAEVYDANNIRITLFNNTGGAIDLASGTWNYKLIRAD